MDHHSHWGSLAELTEAFRAFASPAEGVVLPAGPPPGRIRDHDSPLEILDGDAAGAKRVARFDPEAPGPAALELEVLGEHNRLNARAALAALDLAGFDLGDASRALREFPGVRRRLEYKGRYADNRVFDDYAHHPTEVRAALEALRAERPTSLIVVFQPHLFSRTKSLAEQFGAALALADEVIVLDVYPAREEPVGELEGVTGKLVADAAADRMGGRGPWWAPTHEQALAAVRASAGAEGQIVVTIGAGDVFRLAETLVANGSKG
jgi:UDP-N-acetylmuramate--alanine ligase